MDKKLKSFCNRCNCETNHSVKCEHWINDTVDVEVDGAIEQHCIGTYIYQIIGCNGCESITYKTTENFGTFLSIDERTGKKSISNNKTFETIYPERLFNRISEKKIANLPYLIRRTYREIVDSYNYEQQILCAAGLRAIVEGICLHYNIKDRYLKQKIDRLGSQGLISIELAESLKIHKFLGDNALHQLEIPGKEELKDAIHLVEVALQTLFEIPDKRVRLQEAITKRILNKT